MGKPSASASSSKHSTEKKKSKKRERVEEEEEVYVVEKILDKRVLEDGTVLYYLKWRVIFFSSLLRRLNNFYMISCKLFIYNNASQIYL